MPPTYRDAVDQTKHDMKVARERGSVDVPILRSFLYGLVAGGSDAWNTHARIVRIMQHDPVFDKSRRLYMTRTQRYERGLAMTKRIYELKDQHDWSDAETRVAIGLIDEQIGITLHLLAFEPVILSQTSPSFLIHYAPLVRHRGILGCYLQTELAHGTNVARLETTATYLPVSREFDIHSPSLSSAKWWIGNLGKTATHGVLQARLVLPGGRDVGPHLFFVQLRSLDDHRPLPGIEIGDIGPKASAGYATTDNGYARFTHVRIPREHMLSKFAGVTPEGQYVAPPHAKMSYGGMMYIRAQLISTCGWLMAKAAAISIRYCTVRQQGNTDASGLERQVLSYPSVHIRLLPILARAYVFIVLGRRLSEIFDATSARLTSGDTSTLSDTHVLTSATKALATAHAVHDLEGARRAMGGHGYSAYAGLGRMYAEQLPLVTVEGDNYVLDRQVVRAAVKAFRQFGQASGALPLSARYLRVLSGSLPSISPASWQEMENVVLLLQWRAARMVQDLATRPDDDSELDASVDQRVAKAVAEAIVAEQVADMERDARLEGKERGALGNLLLLYLLTTVETSLADFLTFNLLPAGIEASRGLRAAIGQVCRAVLGEAVGLTDAFGFMDWELDSALGVQDGNVYEKLWERVQSEPLNETEVARAYEQYIKPIIERGRALAARDRERSKL